MERCFSGAAPETSRTATNKSAPPAIPTLRDPQFKDLPLKDPRNHGPRNDGPLVEGLRIRLLIERINSQSAEQLGVEVGGFLGHDFAGQGNVTHLRDAAGIDQK